MASMHVLNQTLYNAETVFASCSCGWYLEYERFPLGEDFEDDRWKREWKAHFKNPPQLTISL